MRTKSELLEYIKSRDYDIKNGKVKLSVAAKLKEYISKSSMSFSEYQEAAKAIFPNYESMEKKIQEEVDWNARSSAVSDLSGEFNGDLDKDQDLELPEHSFVMYPKNRLRKL